MVRTGQAHLCFCAGRALHGGLLRPAGRVGGAQLRFYVPLPAGSRPMLRSGGFPGMVMSQRGISFIPKLAVRMIKVPAYIGGGAAAVGSYIAYKVEEASSFTSDKLSQLRDFSSGVRDRLGEWLDAGGSENGDGGQGGRDGGPVGDSVAAATLLATLSEEEQAAAEDEDDEEEEDEDHTGDEILNLTKQMIEIRSILNRVDTNTPGVTLPSIVVVGSQSSGKSSVLESIVGRDFLPKGSNMVTRRPIELTLVNTPSGSETTADFPTHRIYNLKDFREVKRILMELNLAVPTHEAISEDPIQLTIKSPRVPDLSLVDLPGYIQVEAADQPMELKSKIRNVCQKYLAEPNIILAISAADVDLANSAALRASKLADPQGLRTIGVITKLDLVEPSAARDLLMNKKYPLKMGYVGVITKGPVKTHRLFDQSAGKGVIFGGKGSKAKDQETERLETIQFEKNYFREHRQEFASCQVTTKKLREKLIKILEVSMSNALEPTSRVIQQELDDTSYLFKVEFNDRQLTPKSYLLSNVDVLKLAIKEFQEKFRRSELKSMLSADLDQRVLDLLASRYWKDDNLQELSKNLDDESSALYWHKKLELASSSLTKLGIGRLSTTLVTNAILKELENVLAMTPLKAHELIKELITNTAVNVLNAKYYSTADQVENCIKPFKYEIDLEDRDWSIARDHSVALVQEELRQCNERYQMIKNSVGTRKLQQVMQYIKTDPTRKESLGFSTMLLERGSEALSLQDRASLLSFRLKMLKNKCNSTAEKDKCPEVFLNAVSDKLTSTAVLFLNVELLSDFFYNFPIELDKKLSALSEEQVEMFAKEDPRISRHIELQKRKELLELALEKIDSILVFRKSYKNLAGKSHP
ncbi:ACR164Cp [Eremothecium gossypii ATCC 10895]|uniref:dynamin GTPase n=1 Tax=Eremothecium gossypii (strain ATCC 10895 / CBS 109.51 / FGSC 9923 / NRRL Y-1056) TaxID=284811 RepID=Q75BV7_EREGS|nr:ACR164Cp [Eremothecium gossypii ATCC 10895]AAS51390.2 ACR164Cp [Eremothecium gossypii ATCC 10895]AEY95681.1 FACR164Cp [Eremothecium gossypii FDAG1]